MKNRSVGKLLLGSMIAVGAAFVFWSPQTAFAVAILTIVAAVTGSMAAGTAWRIKMGGYSGDCLGMTIEVSELLYLALATMIL